MFLKYVRIQAALIVLCLLWGIYPTRASEENSPLQNSEEDLTQSTQQMSQNASSYYKTGLQHWRKGNLTKAIAVWKKEADLYQSQNQSDQEIEALLRISQGYIKLGQFKLAISNLEKIETLPIENLKLQAIVHKRLGNAHNGNGDYPQAIASYKRSLKKEIQISTLNNLVKTLQQFQQRTELLTQQVQSDQEASNYSTQAQNYRIQALKYAKQALTLSQEDDSLSSVHSLIAWNYFQENSLDGQQLKRGKSILNESLPSRSLVFVMLQWAEVDSDNKALWLSQAKKIAQNLQDAQAESYVLLALAKLNRESKNFGQALEYAKQAQIKAKSELLSKSLFQSQHLTGKIYREMGEDSIAMESYRNAIASIDTIAQNTASTNIKAIVEFNQEIQPIYRETLELIFDQPKVSSVDLIEALTISDKLRLSQLRNYFGDNCFEIQRRELTNDALETQKKAILINSIILEEKVIFILQSPSGKMVKSEFEISRHKLISEADQWYAELKTGYTWQFKTRSQFFYDLIVKPFEAELQNSESEILVFVHDGILRNLPMAALFDGDRYLVEDWAVVSSLGSFLTPSSTDSIEPKALIFGLSNPPQAGWSTLKEIPQEVKRVEEIMGGDNYLDQEFTLDNLTKQMSRKDHSILHLATHGYFGGSAETSFILAYDQEISALELEDILAASNQNTDLLVLSACETAVTSELALLGLAGTAARSGVASTLGSLWQVQDKKQSEIIEQFYSFLDQNLNNKAIALQRVQIEQINHYAHPSQWAALTLIGDW